MTAELINIKRAAELLLAQDDILFLCHKNPDGDTIGTAGALYNACTSLGKNAAILCEDEIAPRYSYMKMRMYDGSFKPQYVVAVDIASIQLMGEVDYGKEQIDLCIDHHPSNTKYAKMLLLDEKAAATCEILPQLLRDMGVEITPTIADCIYTGVTTDTGCFRFSNTTPRTHRVAAELMELGANYRELNALLFENKSRERLEIERLALATLEYHFGGRCAVIVVTQDMISKAGAKNVDLEGITGIARAIEGVDVGVTIRQLGSSYKVSVRTSSAADATEICARLGGGGHKRAAGCEIIGELANVKTALLSEVEKQLK